LNANATAGELWGSGDVKFGPDGTGQIVLSPKPFYNNRASEIGGGAVGLVPFGTHHSSCVPEHDTVKIGAAASLTIQFYGPVKPQDNTKMPVKVYRGPFGSSDWNLFTDMTADFDIAYPADRKQVQVVPGTAQLRPRYRYRIVPITSNPGTGETLLLCDGLQTQSDVPVYGQDYWIDVDVALSTLDMSGNDWVDEPDAALWLNDPQDFDSSGAADANDFMLITESLGEPVD
jgi:hypothetical protein